MRTMLPITEVARELGLRDEDFELYGRTMGKVSLRVLDDPPRGAGRLVLVSAITPTPAGEGKTTTSIALGMGMRRIGKRPVVALRQPSLGPIFGIKGGGTGGGRARRWSRPTASTSTSPATSTPSPRRTTSYRRSSTTPSSGATASAAPRSTRGR